MVGLFCWSGARGVSAAADGDGVKIAEQDGKLRVQVGGELFTEYHYQGASRPFLYPVLGPGGVPLTRNWPMQTMPGEQHDHPHQKSLWWEHGDINGHDFWSEEPRAGKTLHEKFLEVKSGADAGVIRATNNYVASDGTLVARDERTLHFYRRTDGRMLDFEITIRGVGGPLVFGDSKEGTMGMRINEAMRLTRPNNQPGVGHIVNSEGVRDGETWGKRAEWVDYYAPLNGQVVGIAIFDHPQNPRHPTWWHVRDYGLFAANPFGLHEFEKKPPGAGKLTVPAGESITFRYRFFFHRGDERAGQVAEHYREYAGGTKA
jgi:hypothetical protein